MLGLLLTVSLLVSGCVPTCVSPFLRVSGVVVDANKGVPIGGAKITGVRDFPSSRIYKGEPSDEEGEANWMASQDADRRARDNAKIYALKDANWRVIHEGGFYSIISTDNKGRFAFRKEREWMWLMPFIKDYWPIGWHRHTLGSGTIVIQREGYHSALKKYSTTNTKLKLAEPIRLKPLEK